MAVTTMIEDNPEPCLLPIQQLRDKPSTNLTSDGEVWTTSLEKACNSESEVKIKVEPRPMEEDGEHFLGSCEYETAILPIVEDATLASVNLMEEEIPHNLTQNDQPKMIRKPRKKVTGEEFRRQQRREREQMRRERIKADPVLYEIAKANDRMRYWKKKVEGKLKPTSQMTQRQAISKHMKYWNKLRESNHRTKQKKALEDNIQVEELAVTTCTMIEDEPDSTLLPLQLLTNKPSTSLTQVKIKVEPRPMEEDGELFLGSCEYTSVNLTEEVLHNLTQNYQPKTLQTYLKKRVRDSKSNDKLVNIEKLRRQKMESERKRREKIKADPVLYEKAKKNSRRRYLKRKEEGKLRTTNHRTKQKKALDDNIQVEDFQGMAVNSMIEDEPDSTLLPIQQLTKFRSSEFEPAILPIVEDATLTSVNLEEVPHSLKQNDQPKISQTYLQKRVCGSKPKNKLVNIEKLRRQKRECEKKRRDRIKADPVLYQRAKEDGRKRYLKRKEEGKLKLISQMDQKQANKQRKDWKLRTANHRSKQKKALEYDNIQVEEFHGKTVTTMIEDDPVPSLLPIQHLTDKPSPNLTQDVQALNSLENVCSDEKHFLGSCEFETAILPIVEEATLTSVNLTEEVPHNLTQNDQPKVAQTYLQKRVSGSKDKLVNIEKLRRQKREYARKKREKIKADPMLHETAKANGRKIYLKRKEEGKLKLISQMTQKQAKKQREDWKLRRANHRTKRKKSLEDDNIQVEEFHGMAVTTMVEDDTDSSLLPIQQLTEKPISTNLIPVGQVWTYSLENVCNSESEVETIVEPRPLEEDGERFFGSCEFETAILPIVEDPTLTSVNLKEKVPMEEDEESAFGSCEYETAILPIVEDSTVTSVNLKEKVPPSLTQEDQPEMVQAYRKQCVLQSQMRN